MQNSKTFSQSSMRFTRILKTFFAHSGSIKVTISLFSLFNCFLYACLFFFWNIYSFPTNRGECLEVLKTTFYGWLDNSGWYRTHVIAKLKHQKISKYLCFHFLGVIFKSNNAYFLLYSFFYWYLFHFQISLVEVPFFPLFKLYTRRRN